MATILVTGATGFIGGSVARRLVADGHTVRALVRRTSSIGPLQTLGAELCIGDVTDADSVRVAAVGVDAVVHCAALASDWGPWTIFEQINVAGTRNVLDAALDAEARRFVHISTSDVFGVIRDGGVINDEYPLKKSGYPYPDTKIDAENMVFECGREKGLSVVVLRPTWVYGPGDRTFIPEVVHAMRTRQMFYIGSRGNLLSTVYIDSVVQAVLLALIRDEAVGRGYIVSDGEITWKDLVANLAKGLRIPAPLITIPRSAARAAAIAMETWSRVSRSAVRPVMTRFVLDFTASSMRYSAERIQTELGFKSAVTIDEGMQRTIEWLKTVDITKLKAK